MTRRLLTSIGLVAFTFVLAAPRDTKAADPSRLRTTISTLASERFGGRLTGTDGERLAREFIVAELKRIGAKPLPGQHDFTLPFEFVAGARDGGTTLSIAGKARALSFSESGEVAGAVVFAGYGIVVPESQDFGYDSYATLDVKDKVVVVLRYFPEDAEAKTKGILSRYADLRFKAMAARQRGAKAVLVVTGPRSPNAGELVPMTFDTALSGSGIVAVSIDGQAGNALMAAAGKTIADVQQSLDSGNTHVAGFEIPGTVTVKTQVERERHEAYNIAGYLPATSRVALPKPWLAVGAHYDHLGRGENGSSLASKEEAGRVHGGADDNASGDAAVLALGEELSKQQRPRHGMLAFWSGEELGLLGSAAFVASRRFRSADLAGLSQLRHGRAHAGQQAERPGQRYERHLGEDGRAGERPGRLQRQSTARSLPADRRHELQLRRCAVPELLHRLARRLPQTERYGGQDRLRRPRAHRRLRGCHRETGDRHDRSAGVRQGRTADGGRRQPGRRACVHRHGPRLRVGREGPAARRRGGRRTVLSRRTAEGRRRREIASQTIANIYDYITLDVLKIGSPRKVVYMRAGEGRETTLTRLCPKVASGSDATLSSRLRT
jgi:hypothetical protein